MVKNYYYITCGELNEKSIGQKVNLRGWVNSWRDLGGVVFIELRDTYGFTQVVFESFVSYSIYSAAKHLRNEFVVSIIGSVRIRPEGTENLSLKTGKVEVLAEQLEILNVAKPAPFQIHDNAFVPEELRLKYRFLDLRRPRMQTNIKYRHEVNLAVRNYLSSNRFVEIETPILMKSTPEGARDFLVPSRLHPGKFYALPQSPQLYKQLLMISGFDKYFQIVKCFRDEDLRSDRQPEFTQIDIEVSFPTEEMIMSLIEGLISEIMTKVFSKKVFLPFKRISYSEALEKYGSDKPDLRYLLEMCDVTHVFENTNFNVLKMAPGKSQVITAMRVPNMAEMGKSQLDSLIEFVQKLGSGGMIWMRLTDEGFEFPTQKYFSEQELQQLRTELSALPGDLVLILSGDRDKTLHIMGKLRVEVATRYGIFDEHQLYSFLWVTDFPLFSKDQGSEQLSSMHHPFTSPRSLDIDSLRSAPLKASAMAYDLTLNGHEIAGGSIRIHNMDLQMSIFELLGISKETATDKFGFLLEALQYGAPPHGGIAVGMDRLLMLLLGENSIREVMAFPKSSSGISLMDDNPSFATTHQLDELHIRLKK